MVDNIAIENLVGALKSDKKDNQSAYMAVVTKKDNDGTVWVQIAGSNIETPVEATSVDVKSGDAVAVEWRNNRLYIAGNTSNPSAGVARVVNVENAARIANQAAQNAVADAGIARQAAESAQATVAEIEDDVTGLNARLTTAEGNITTIEGNITTLGGRVTTAEGKITTVEGNITNLTTRVTDAEDSISGIESDVHFFPVQCRLHFFLNVSHFRVDLLRRGDSDFRVSHAEGMRDESIRSSRR